MWIEVDLGRLLGVQGALSVGGTSLWFGCLGYLYCVCARCRMFGLGLLEAHSLTNFSDSSRR